MTILRKLLYFILCCLTIGLPLIISSVWVALLFDATLFDHVPAYNDEIMHWHQTLSFAEVGFANGYYTFNENIPLADYSHYYAWGAFPYVFYGLIVRVIGINLATIALINITVFMLSVAFLLITTRPNYTGLLGVLAVLATFIPLLNYIPSTMLQVLNLAIGVVFAAIFYKLLTGQVSRTFIILSVLFALLTGLIRPTYALYLAPMLALAKPIRNWKTIVISGFQALPLVVLAAVGFYTSAAPFPHFRTLLILGDDPLATKLADFGAYLQQSFVWMTEGDPIVMAQRFQIALLLVCLVLWAIWMIRREIQSRRANTAQSGKEAMSLQWRWEFALHSYNLVGFYTATIMFHETLGGHDYRVMAPHLLLSLLLLALCHRRAIVAILVVFTLLWMPAAWNAYAQDKGPNFSDATPIQFGDWRSLMGDDLVYDPDAPSPWCNTVTTSAFYVLNPAGEPAMRLAVPPGIGLSWTFDWVFPGFDLPVPDDYKTPDSFQSHYLILTDDDYAAWGQSLNLERLERAPQGALYRNLDSPCP